MDLARDQSAVAINAHLTPIPLRLIAEEAGYSSESALSRAFKSQCGLSPMAWLKQERLVQ